MRHHAGGRSELLIGLGLGVMVLVLGAESLGWLGALVVCGADGAAVCVAWPAVASIATWLLFFGVIGGLGAWHIREWRRDPTPSSDPPPPSLHRKSGSLRE